MWMSILYLPSNKKEFNAAASSPILSKCVHFINNDNIGCFCVICSPSIETPPFASAALPVAAVPRILFGLDMEVIDMIHQVLQGVKEQMALEERKHSAFHELL